MNNNKIKYLWEIVYNCPFILLLLFTACIAIPCYYRMENRENGEKEAIIKTIEKEVEAAAEKPEEKKEENEGTRKKNISKIENEVKQNTDTQRPKIAIKPAKEETRATEFVEYTPIETNSRYYSDAGKVALTTTYDYVLENDSYFNDAVFLGDSRTLGISDYAGLEGADFFCDNGMTIYKLLEDTGVTWQRTGEKVDLKEILQEKRYGKIYIMLGMNELGYGDTPMYLKQYLKVIRQLQEWQPDAIIYVMANLHVSREKNDMESEFNNININDKNVAVARLADGKSVFYLDCNPLFTDEEGYLQAELTFDGVHLYAQHYDKWRTFLMEHGVEREEGKESAVESDDTGESAAESEDAGESAAESKDTGESAAGAGEG